MNMPLPSPHSAGCPSRGGEKRSISTRNRIAESAIVENFPAIPSSIQKSASWCVMLRLTLDHEDGKTGRWDRRNKRYGGRV